MTLDEYSKLEPGTRVIAKIKGHQVRGIMGNGYGANGVTPMFKSDNGAILFITKEMVSVFEVEPLN